LWDEASFPKRHPPWRTHIALGLAYVEAAVQLNVPWRILLCDRWDLAAPLAGFDHGAGHSSCLCTRQKYLSL
jgi:hypothetical protein